MPQLNTIVLNDGTTDHSFQPRGVDANGVASLAESSGIPIGDSRLTVSRSRTNQGREKVVIKMTVPVVMTATVNGVSDPTIVRSAYADITFSFDGKSTTAERNNMRKMVYDLLGDSQTFGSAVIGDLETLF